MVTYMIRLILIFVFVFSLVAQSTQSLQWITSSPPKRDLAKIPHYLLVLRYWAIGCMENTTISSGASIQCGGWVYLNETYESLEAVLERLNKSLGSAQWQPQEVVGIWRLDNTNKLKVSFKDIEKKIPKHIEEQKWVERSWEVLSLPISP